METPQTLNESKAEAFAERMIGVLNEGALALMLSIGHRTGLFDVLSKLDGVTSDELADKAKLHERYVREWLAALVTAGVVEYEAEEKKYRLPAEHAAFLTRAASPDNIAVFAQYIPMLGTVEERIIDCFHNGGGVGYEAFDRFHQIMAEDSGQTVVAALIEHILPLAPGLVGQLEAGIDVLDVGCGAGRAMNLLAERFPASRFAGYDISEEAITTAKEAACAQGLPNVRFEVTDVTKLDESEGYDLVTAFDAIHDQVDPASVLASIHRELRPDGVFLMQDIAASSRLENNLDHPIAPLLYTLSCMHCMTVSLAGGGAGLGTMWGEDLAREMLADAGFTRVEVSQLAHDFQNSYYIVRKD